MISPDATEASPTQKVSLATIAREWTRIGCIGFGGPPTHIILLRRLCVEERHWMPAGDFEDGIAATSLLPGPASTQLAIFCAWRLRKTAGAVVGGLCFIVPGLVLILGLSAVFLASHPPAWILGLAAGAGAAVPAVAVNAARALLPASWKRIGRRRGQHARWLLYALAGGSAAALAGQYLVGVLLVCGLVEVALRRRDRPAPSNSLRGTLPAVGGHALAAGGIAGGLGAVAWVAFKVGALSYGGGFVIIPLMQHDAVVTYHWLTASQFLDAVALGQVTPGPVVQTVAVVGYAAAGLGGGLVAAFVAFSPSFLFVILGGPRFDRIRGNRSVSAFFSGAGPAVIGAIAGAAIPLGLSFQHLWQIPVLGGSLLWLVVARRGVVSTLLLAGALGVLLAVSGVPV
ncbi:MAG: chromate efflux transporter [Acidimicrobiales bacterium]